MHEAATAMRRIVGALVAISLVCVAAVSPGAQATSFTVTIVPPAHGTLRLGTTLHTITRTPRKAAGKRRMG